MNISDKEKTRISKFMSLVLRHQPEAAGVTVDPKGGWAKVSALIHGMRQKGFPITEALLEEIVAEDAKQRYSFDATHTKIRANQGHSFPVELGLTPLTPPEFLWHGTASRFLDGIFREGLCKMQRQHVHLSPDPETAMKVGARHGKAIVLRVRALDMHRAGYVFFCSDNGVWLTEHVPPEFLEIMAQSDETTAHILCGNG
jgi:putative RNA 2'-phosphotransferase